jgi:GDPmannose 4,6-dehydratase
MQWLMLQQPCPADYVIATGEQYSVREFVNLAAKHLDLELCWGGAGEDSKGYDQHGRLLVEVDPRYFRPAEVETLLGDPTKARRELGWSPRTTFPELVAEMITEDLRSAERDLLVERHGYRCFSFHES